MRDGAWLVRLCGGMVPELQRGYCRPYGRASHALSHLYQDIQCRLCTLRNISCQRFGYLWIVVKRICFDQTCLPRLAYQLTFKGSYKSLTTCLNLMLRKSIQNEFGIPLVFVAGMVPMQYVKVCYLQRFEPGGIIC